MNYSEEEFMINFPLYDYDIYFINESRKIKD